MCHSPKRRRWKQRQHDHYYSRSSIFEKIHTLFATVWSSSYNVSFIGVRWMADWLDGLAMCVAVVDTCTTDYSHMINGRVCAFHKHKRHSMFTLCLSVSIYSFICMCGICKHKMSPASKLIGSDMHTIVRFKFLKCWIRANRKRNANKFQLCFPIAENIGYVFIRWTPQD